MIMKMSNNEELAILVISCDKYADLWGIFFELFNKFWPDCKYPLYLGSNAIRCDVEAVRTICVGEDKSWADNVQNMLTEISEAYVLVFLEDFFLEQVVESEVIEQVFQYMLKNKVDCLRLCPSPPPSKIIEKELGIGIIKHSAPYCISTQPAIWKKSALKKLLHQGYSAWDFEKQNSANMSNSDLKLMGTNRFYIKRHNGVERGKYYTSTLKLLKENGIEVDISERGMIDDLTLKKRVWGKIYRTIQFIRVKLSL